MLHPIELCAVEVSEVRVCAAASLLTTATAVRASPICLSVRLFSWRRGVMFSTLFLILSKAMQEQMLMRATQLRQNWEIPTLYKRLVYHQHIIT